MIAWPARRRRPPAEPTPEAAWAAAEVEPWSRRKLEASAVSAEFDRLASLNETAVRLDIDGSRVTLAQARELPPGLAPLRSRAVLYRRLLEDVVRLYGLDIRVPVLVDVNDTQSFSADVPLVGFQKTAGSPVLLAPDVDILDHNFFVDAEYQDGTAFQDKRDAAIFVGSTTGGGWLDAQMVRDRVSPRLAAAEHFKGARNVVFELPQIVQTQSEEVSEMIRAMGLGSRRFSWAEQFGYKVLLSMDGNGATCSRVAVALASRCMLAKFASEHSLYFFRGLEPGRHYAPIARYEDVDRLIEDLERRPAACASLAEAGQAFAGRHLCRPAVYEYTAELLIRYAQVFQGGVETQGAVLAPPRLLVDAVASSATGRRWGGLNAWAGAPRTGIPLTELAVFVSPRIPAEQLTCRVLDAAGREHAFEEAGASCAAPEGGALHGLALHLSTPAGDHYALSYEALFVDGGMSGPVSGGGMARSASGAALEAFRVTLTPR